MTGDLLSFLRCGLQYRYHNGSALPPSRPVQLWFGEFIHGVMEAAYRIWVASSLEFPWPCTVTPRSGDPPPVPTDEELSRRPEHDIGCIGDTVEQTLRSQGKNPRSRNTRASAYRRAQTAVNEVAPHLFPLVASAEERVIGTRDLPPAEGGMVDLRTSRYQLHGVIDVLTDLQLDRAPSGNVIRDAIVDTCPEQPDHFEVVVDYKGSRRPSSDHAFWEQADWQVQTYAWLRMRQPESLPVVAGLLIYVNELAPGAEDVRKLQREVQQGRTDVTPPGGSRDAYQLRLWQSGGGVPGFSLSFRMQRAIRVVPVTQQSLRSATSEFDNVVRNIEQCVAAEAAAGAIGGNWNAGGDEPTCVACDFRHFCPSPAPREGNQPRTITAPPAP
ncbi:MAG: PD-(D/E)XK nuclease family protein [Planctomycetota bacterium]